MTDEMKVLLDVQKQVSAIASSHAGMEGKLEAVCKMAQTHNKEIYGNGSKGIKAKLEGISMQMGIYAAAGVFVGSTITAVVLQAMVKKLLGAG